MSKNNSSSSSSKSIPLSVNDRDLLNFYKRKYEEFQRKEDKYKEKVDKHLKNLVTDRHELEEEVLRRGEKIADLQKALVELQLSVFEERERFLKVSSENEELKRNEKDLHESIRQLLAMTSEQDLRDKIIYILKDPKVDIGYRTDISSKSKPAHEVTANQKLKEELDKLKQQLDEVLRISKNKSDVVIDDCKEALEKSKIKIMQDEIQIKELQKMLQELQALEKNKSSVTATKISSAEKQRAGSIGKKVSADRQRTVPIGKNAFGERQRAVALDKNVYAETRRTVPFDKNIFAEWESLPTTAKSVSQDSISAVAVGESIPAEKHSFHTVRKEDPHEILSSKSAGKSISAEKHLFHTARKEAPHELLNTVPVIKSISAEDTKTLKAAKSQYGKNQRYAIATTSISGESLPITQSSADSEARTLKAAKNQFGNNQRYAIATTSISGESLPVTQSSADSEVRTLKAAKNQFGNNQRYAIATTSISGEGLPITQSSVDSDVRTLKAVKSQFGTNQQYAVATEESLPVAQSSVDSEVLSKLCSLFKDIHLSLILLLKINFKVKNILNSIKATKLYHRMAKIPRTPADLQLCVDEDTIIELEKSLRQCTRLTFDINNMVKSLFKYVTLNKNKIQSISGLKSELNYLENQVKEMTRLTADNDLINLGLQRSNFLSSLTDSSVIIPEENRLSCLEDFQEIISKSETLTNTISETTEFVESVIEKYAVKRDFHDIADSLRDFSYLSSERHSTILQDRSDSNLANAVALKQGKSKSLQNLEQLVGIYKRAAQDSENLGLPTKRLTERIKAAERILHADELKKCDDNYDEIIMESDASESYTVPSDHEDILRKIDRTLSKVELLEQGKYYKDEQMCRKLAENVDALTKQFRELTQEFNVKSVQEQFSEYSKVTLSKLEELAKQCKNSVIAAEAQIAAHRSNAKHLSEKLKETEELLRESINECLSLKQKTKQTEAEHEMEKFTLISNLKEKLEHQTSQGVDEVIEELVSKFPAYETIKSTPYICMYCRHGPGHKHCEEKIKELAAESRKFKTQLKLLKQETDQEKFTLKNHREIAESSLTDLTKQNQSMKNALEALEKKNASLLEQLKVEKNRLKNMERFRRLEIEGFQTDIKLLKGKIKELEKQLLKAVLIFESNHKDVELLKIVHETAHRSEQATATLRRLKAKLYQLENDIKNL